MNRYKVSVYATVFVDADTAQDAEDMAHDMVIGCSIRAREFEFDTEEWEDEA